MKPKLRRPSSKDVAALAGVSLGSVSRVINKFENVTPAVRDKVERAMAALDYRLNHAAQTLRSRTSRTVGCMLTDVTNPLYANLFRVFEDKFRREGYMVLLANSLNHAEWEVDILEMFRTRGMDGVLIAPSNERNAKVVAAVNQLGIPAVIVDRDMAAHQDHVQFDHVHGIAQAVSHLLGLGHRHIAIVVSSVASRPMRRRVEGFRAGFLAHGLKPAERLIVRLPASTSNAFAPVTEMLLSAHPPTAIFSLGTNVLGDVLSAISAQGLRVPQDISVVSMGDPAFVRSHVPAIATVTVDLDLAASESSRLLLERMRGEYVGKPRRVVVPTEFEARESCARVSRRASHPAVKRKRSAKG
jgi:LacI family transcriptional regulator